MYLGRCGKARFTTAVFKTRGTLTNYLLSFHYAMVAMKQ